MQAPHSHRRHGAAVVLAGWLALSCGTAACGARPAEPPAPAPVASASVVRSTDERAPAPSEAAPEHGTEVRCPDDVEPSGASWTCPMHPDVRAAEGGTCPICAMDLVEAQSGWAMTDATPPDVGAVPRYASRDSTGLASCVVRPGLGRRHPSPQDTVTVHYVGWTTDGTPFDHSLRRGAPATIPLRHTIEGWVRGVSLMVEGEVRRLWIPAELAYGEGGPGRPAGMLVFDIELLRIEER